jgi:hypothetical protein
MTLSMGEDSRVPIRPQAQDREVHILAAMRNAGVPVLVPGADQLLYIGKDDRGVELEVIAVPDDRNPGGVTVIHAMPTSMRGDSEEEVRR